MMNNAGIANEGEVSKSIDGELVHCYLKRTSFGKKVIAEAILLKDGRMVLLKGSVVSDSIADSSRIQNVRYKYKNYIENGVVIKDIMCTSPSNAAVIVVGNSVNGWDVWKDERGRTIQYYRNLITDSTGTRLYETYEDSEGDYFEEEQQDGAVNMYQQEELGSMQEELIPVPKVSLSRDSINKLNNIVLQATDRVINEIQGEDFREVEHGGVQYLSIEDRDEYSIEDRNEEVIGIPFERVRNAVQRGMNVLYRGVPGCGKTYTANCDARALIGLKILIEFFKLILEKILITLIL